MVLERVAEVWRQDRDRIEESGREAIEQLSEQYGGRGSASGVRVARRQGRAG